MKRLLERVRAELEASALVRAGAWAIGAILLLSLALNRADAVGLAHADYLAESRRLSSAEGAMSDADWADRLEAERALNAELEGLFWHADFEGHARAELEAALDEIFAPLELRQRRVRVGVSQPAPGLPGVWQVQARLVAEYRAGAELGALHAVATYPRKLVVERFVVSRNNRRIDAIVSAYFTGFDVEAAAADR